MKTPRIRKAGFTLIELLTVIAIISILAAMIAVALPRALEKSKIASMQNTLNQVRTIMVNYTTDHATYPPAYGYLRKEAFGQDPSTLTVDDFITRPYLAYLGEFNNRELYDRFSLSYDTDRDGNISLLEFLPLGTPTGVDSVTFPPDLYSGSNLGGVVAQLLNEEGRPFIYIPVNKRQASRVADVLFASNPADPRPRSGETNPFTGMTFPPPSYDTFVLIGVGPSVDTFGILQESLPSSWQSEISGSYTYHALALLTYFMATRDADRNGQLDFHFESRTRRGEAQNPNNQLPTERAPNGPGPWIYVMK